MIPIKDNYNTSKSTILSYMTLTPIFYLACFVLNKRMKSFLNENNLEVPIFGWGF